jgi:protein-tyrosine kinase
VSRIERALSRAAPQSEGPDLKADRPPETKFERTTSEIIEISPSTVDPRLVAVCDPHSAVSEHFRRLKVKLRLIPQRTRSILFTSAVKGEGKSTTWLNLAVTMAHDPDYKVIAIDADLRRNALQNMIEIPEGPGLTDIVRGDVPLEDAIRATSLDGLSLLPAGSPVTDPVELLSLPKTSETLRKLTARYDCVLVDGPPVLAVTDSTVLGTLVDSVVLVVRALKTSRAAVKRAVSLLDKSEVIGFVLNRSPESSSEYYYKYYKKQSRKEK